MNRNIFNSIVNPICPILSSVSSESSDLIIKVENVTDDKMTNKEVSDELKQTDENDEFDENDDGFNKNWHSQQRNL